MHTAAMNTLPIGCFVLFLNKAFLAIPVTPSPNDTNTAGMIAIQGAPVFPIAPITSHRTKIVMPHIKQKLTQSDFHKIDIYDRTFEKIDQIFSMITANLRYPTIKRLLPYMYETVYPKGLIVLSGIKINEIKDLLDIYKEKNFLCRWKENEQDWVGVVFEKVV